MSVFDSGNGFSADARRGDVERQKVCSAGSALASPFVSLLFDHYQTVLLYVTIQLAEHIWFLLFPGLPCLCSAALVFSCNAS